MVCCRRRSPTPSRFSRWADQIHGDPGDWPCRARTTPSSRARMMPIMLCVDGRLAAVGALLALVCKLSSSQAAEVNRALVLRGQIAIHRCHNATQPPRDCRLLGLRLTEPELREFRELVASVQLRQEVAHREAERDGKVTGGVWGFVSYSYRIAFVNSETSGYAWLHVTDDAAWIEGDEQIGNVVFDRTESRKLRKIMFRLEVATEPDKHRSASAERSPATIVKGLPVAVVWKEARTVDINCDQLPDKIFVASDAAHYYVAAVIAPFDETSTPSYVALNLSGNAQRSLCGEPRDLIDDSMNIDIVEVLGDSPQGWQRSAACKGLRLDSGECDSFHLYWNRVERKIGWWRL